MSLKVFISYSGADHEIVEGLNRLVKEQGATPQLAESVTSPGAILENKIKDMISKSDLIIAVLTVAGTRAQWVNWELGAASALKKRIVPMLEDGAKLPPCLEGKEYIKFTKANIDVAFRAVSGFIQRYVTKKRLTDLLALTLMVIGLVVFLFALVMWLFPRKKR